ncbi:GNAT family N-acetyltransferase [Candidatus Latescibacterota bacterium]
MSYDFAPFAEEHVEEAVRLLAGAYGREWLASPHLPEWGRQGNGRGEEFAREHLRAAVGGPGVIAFRDGALCGFMTESMRFEWKGQKVAGCGELYHAIGATDRPTLHRLLYRELARQWVVDGRHLHVVGHLAHDAALREGLFQLGFGAILSEELRGVDPPGSEIESETEVAVEIVDDPDLHDLVELQTEHRRYYRQSPIFLIKDESPDSVLAELRRSADRGDRMFAGIAGGRVVGLFVVGASAAEGEGELLRETNTAQVRSAFVRPESRGQGLGAALLERSVAWGREQGFDRLFVEHETANIPGSAFWGRYFEPFVFYSMRYVDTGL